MLLVDNITVSLQDRRVINGLSCQFAAGEFWGIIGQNGAGKSTFLQCLAGLLRPEQGQVMVDGVDIHQLDPLSRAQKMAYLMQEQEPSLAFSVAQAVEMGRYPWPDDPENRYRLTQQALIDCRIKDLQDRSILKLSGGERRKVELATCLAQHSDYLLLDEPFNHLDVVYQRFLVKKLKTLSREKTVIMVCHDLDVVAQYCSHVLMLLSDDCYLSGDSATMLKPTNLDKLFDEPH
ncbi:ABC transporter ATP-binding protein [Marinicella gelatinilytica]|uniref:ABC transporter ATP-binding protein n=1 Tax=Marinicella gelatinilytica TaxID=2996017 RepID=UPI0022609BFF|nr:ABC transporter ATP-binding protein [Marinicella gelatinilytica]MCX7545640.1 ABC transporter ATP-binding protein [Marinicella gelatinilytica]